MTFYPSFTAATGVRIPLGTPSLRIDQEAGFIDTRLQEELFDRFLDRMPKEMVYERELLKSWLWRALAVWDLT